MKCVKIFSRITFPQDSKKFWNFFQVSCVFEQPDSSQGCEWIFIFIAEGMMENLESYKINTFDFSFLMNYESHESWHEKGKVNVLTWK